MSDNNGSSASARSATIFSRFADGSPVGDVIPFYDDGTYHLFVLTPPPGSLYFPERLYTTWRHLRSRDLLHWEQLPDALAPGEPGAPDDCGIWTGSVIRAEGRYHIFYTGYSLGRSMPQTVCRATSDDGVVWKKDPDNPVSVPRLEHFEGKDWRDPYVFWNEEEGCYWMLLSTRSLRYPAVARGVVALQTSPDLQSWSEPEDLYETFLTHCPECSEMYELGHKWVLAYSRFTDRRGTVYRAAGSPRGPWHHLDSDGPDGAHWYAAKSLADDRGRRLAFGWVPDRNPKPSTTTGAWLWAGDLALPRELSMGEDGQLRASLPAEVVSAASPSSFGRVEFGRGAWSQSDAAEALTLSARCKGEFGYCLLHPGSTSGAYMVSATVSGADAAAVGLAVETGEQLDRGFAVLCHLREGRALAFDLTAAWSELANEYEKATTEYSPVVDSALTGGASDELTLQVVVRGDVVEAFVADRAVLTYRLSSDGGVVALLVQDGSATFGDIRIAALSTQVSGVA